MAVVHEVEGSEDYDRTGTQPLWDDPDLKNILLEILVCRVSGQWPRHQ
jgi:hypothetical protein